MRSVKFLVAAGAASLLSSAAFAADMPIAPPADVRAAPGGRGFRRLVSARRYRLQQSARRAPEQRARCRQSPRRSRTSASTPPASSASASATSSTTGSAPTSPVNIAAIRSSSARITSPIPGGVRHRHLSRHQVRVGRSGQRLCRSRHLVVHHAVHRRRRRRRAGHDQRTSPTRASPITAAARCRASPSATTSSKWNFAWALHAGVAYKVTPNFTVELAYRYLDMGDGLTGDLRTFDGTNTSSTRRRSRTSPRTTSSSACAGTSNSPPVYAPPLIAQGLIEPLIC